MDPKAKKSLFSALFITTLDNFGFALVFILFGPLLLDSTYGMLPEVSSITTRTLLLGVLYASFPLTQFFGAPIIGDFADRFGRKRSFYFTLLGTIIGYLFSGVAILFKDYTSLCISRLVTGFFSGNLSIGMAVIADVSPTEKLRSRNYSIMTVLLGISWSVALLTGGYLSDPTISRFFNPALPFWVTALLSMLALGIVRYFFEESHSGQKKIHVDLIKGVHNVMLAFNKEKVRSFFALILLWTLGWGLTAQWYAPYSILTFKISQTVIAWLLVVQGVSWMIGGSIINPFLIRYLSTYKIVRLAFFLTFILLFFAAISKGFTFFNILYLTSPAFAAIAFANTNNLISINASRDIQGRIMGISQSMMSLGWFIVPLIGGFLGGINPRLFYACATGFFGLGLLILFLPKKAIK